MAKLETQFSIYKIDISLFLSIQGMDKKTPANRAKDILSIILAEIKEEIKKRKDSVYMDIDVDGMRGVVYKTINIPEWDGMISNLITQMNKEKSFVLENTNVSYILLYIVNENIYAMTAGFGNHLIKKNVEKSWGLYLMPKLLGDDAGVIREVKENNLYGNAISLSKANRYSTNLSFEKKMSAVFKELSVEIDDEISTLLGLEEGKKTSKRKTSVLLKDSLNVRKSLKIEELKSVLNEIYKVEQKPDMYSMGYFLSAKKVGITTKVLLEKLQEDILKENLDKICLIGDDYIKYCIGATEYLIYDEKPEIYYSSDNPIKFEELIEQIKEDGNLTKSYINTVLKKWTISTNSVDGNPVLYPISILHSLQGFVEYGEEKMPCFLMQGEWYCFNTRYTSMLNDEFKKIFNNDKTKVQEIKNKYNLKSKSKNEDKFNNTFFKIENVVVAHKSSTEKFEVADLIYWDDKYVYLMCNKSKFDGAGSRDLTNQMWASANYFQNKLNSIERKSFLEDYYDKIVSRYKSNGVDIPIDKDQFVKLFDMKICYVAGYMCGYTLKSRSLYAKYLTIDCYKKMREMGFEYICMNIGG